MVLAHLAAIQPVWGRMGNCGDSIAMSHVCLLRACLCVSWCMFAGLLAPFPSLFVCAACLLYLDMPWLRQTLLHRGPKRPESWPKVQRECDVILLHWEIEISATNWNIGHLYTLESLEVATALQQGGHTKSRSILCATEEAILHAAWARHSRWLCPPEPWQCSMQSTPFESFWNVVLTWVKSPGQQDHTILIILAYSKEFECKPQAACDNHVLVTGPIPSCTETPSDFFMAWNFCQLGRHASPRIVCRKLSLRPIEPSVKHPLCKLGIGPAEVVPIVVRGIIQTETFVHDSSAGRGV